MPIHHVILLNGPAGSGKDTIGTKLQGLIRFETGQTTGIFKFAEPLKRAVAAFFDLTEAEYNYFFETYEGKNTKHPRFFNRTPREWLIGFSEDYAKKFGGKEVFGKLLSSKISRLPMNALITDSGFIEEARTLVNELSLAYDPNFGRPDYCFYLVRLHRKGFDFAGDSRSYLEPEEGLFDKVLDIDNEDGNVDKAVQQIINRTIKDGQ